MNHRYFFLLCAVFTTATLAAQTRTKAKVGVNTQNPTENLHVNGTLRVQKLPTDNEAGAIGTKADGSASANFDQTFNAKYVVTADKNGVLGRAAGADPSFFYKLTCHTSLFSIFFTYKLCHYGIIIKFLCTSGYASHII